MYHLENLRSQKELTTSTSGWLVVGGWAQKSSCTKFVWGNKIVYFTNLAMMITKIGGWVGELVHTNSEPLIHKLSV